MDDQNKDHDETDEFNRFFRILSLGDCNFASPFPLDVWYIPNVKDNTNLGLSPFLFATHTRNIQSDIPIKVQEMFKKHTFQINGLVSFWNCTHSSELIPLIGKGGWEYLGMLDSLGYKTVANLLSSYCANNANYNGWNGAREYEIFLNTDTLNIHKGPIRDMFVSEYNRMRAEARESMYKLSAELFPYIRKHPELEECPSLARIVNAYSNSIQKISNALLVVPKELVVLIVDYHHIMIR